ncbi:MAG: hypothetical protein WC389_05375 [Lutibacter sp.]|jgi:hypothetical protein
MKKIFISLMLFVAVIFTAATCEDQINCPGCYCNCPKYDFKADTLLKNQDSIIVAMNQIIFKLNKLPEIMINCNDTVIVAGYVYKDSASNLFTDVPFQVILQQLNWVLHEENISQKAMTQIFNKIMFLNEHIIFIDKNDSSTLQNYLKSNIK